MQAERFPNVHKKKKLEKPEIDSRLVVLLRLLG